MSHECQRCHQWLDMDEFRPPHGRKRPPRVCHACELEAELKKIYARRKRRREVLLGFAQKARAAAGRD